MIEGKLGMDRVPVLVVSCLLFFATAAKLSVAQEQMTAEETFIRQLNDQYIEAFLKSDVTWYQKHLAEDFICITSSGAVLDKQAFLQDTTKGTEVTAYKLEQVTVKVYGNTALVQATGLFTRKDGSGGKSRYIDVYVRMGADWKVVSAQITRVASPEQ